MSADGGSGHVTPSPAAPTKSPAGRTACEGASGIKPNEAKRNKPVLLTVLSASNVYGIDGKFNPRASWTSDCYVKVTCDCAFVNEKKDGAQQTQPIREDNNPVWHKPSGRTNNHENFVLKFEPSAISDSGSQPTLELVIADKGNAELSRRTIFHHASKHDTNLMKASIDVKKLLEKLNEENPSCEVQCCEVQGARNLGVVNKVGLPKDFNEEGSLQLCDKNLNARKEKTEEPARLFLRFELIDEIEVGDADEKFEFEVGEEEGEEEGEDQGVSRILRKLGVRDDLVFQRLQEAMGGPKAANLATLAALPVEDIILAAQVDSEMAEKISEEAKTQSDNFLVSLASILDKTDETDFKCDDACCATLVDLCKGSPSVASLAALSMEEVKKAILDGRGGAGKKAAERKAEMLLHAADEQADNFRGILRQVSSGVFFNGNKYQYDDDELYKYLIDKAGGHQVAKLAALDVETIAEGPKVNMSTAKKIRDRANEKAHESIAQEKQAKEYSESKKAKEDKKKKEMEKDLEILSKMPVIDGTYTVKIHIIEVRDLKAEDWNGASDPVVILEAFGRKESTEVKRNCLSCVFDRSFEFELKNQTRESLEAGLIKISVYDVDYFSKDLIGSFATDFETIYFHKDANGKFSHELYRKWVALIDNKNPRDSGTQGFLKLSVQIIGPEDKPVYHDLAKELKAESLQTARDMEVIMPHIQQKLNFLIVRCYWAEKLPPFDFQGITASGLHMTSKTDAYIEITLGADTVKTHYRTVPLIRDTEHCSDADFFEEIYIPFFYPTAYKFVHLQVFDADSGLHGNQLIGTVPPIKFEDISIKRNKLGMGSKRPPDPMWLPVMSGASLWTNRGMGTDARRFMDSEPESASTCSGVVVASFEVDKNDGYKKKSQGIYSYEASKKVPRAFLPGSFEPEIHQERKLVDLKFQLKDILRQKFLSEYKLKVDLFDWCGLPLGRRSKIYEIRFEVGAFDRTSKEERISFTVETEEPKVLECYSRETRLQLPSKWEELPDLFIYLSVGTEGETHFDNICFQRLKLAASEPEPARRNKPLKSWPKSLSEESEKPLEADMYEMRLLMGQVGLGKLIPEVESLSKVVGNLEGEQKEHWERIRSSIKRRFEKMVEIDSQPVNHEVTTRDRAGLRLVGFGGAACWIPLRADPAHSAKYRLKDGRYPGAVLAKIQFDLADKEARKEEEEAGEGGSAASRSTLKYEKVKVKIFRATNLAASDFNGLSDPYVQVRIKGMVKKTGTVKESLNPEFWTQLLFDVPLEVGKKELWPMLAIEVFDRDKFDADDLLGTAHISLGSLSKKPRWEPLDTQGGVLLQVELITPAEIQDIKNKNKQEELEDGKYLGQQTELVDLHIHPLGLRDLEPASNAIGKTFTEFAVEGGPRVKTDPTSTPSATNPNFGNGGEILKIKANLPMKPGDDLFVPCVAVSVFDQHFGSKFFTSTLCHGSIDLVPAVKAYRIFYWAAKVLREPKEFGECKQDDSIEKLKDYFDPDDWGQDLKKAKEAGVLTLGQAQDETKISELEKQFRGEVHLKGRNPFIEDEGSSNLATREAQLKLRRKDVRLTLFPTIQQAEIQHLRDQREAIERRQQKGDDKEMMEQGGVEEKKEDVTLSPSAVKQSDIEATGPEGDAGRKGSQGLIGVQGPTGRAGPQGRNKKSASSAKKNLSGVELAMKERDKLSGEYEGTREYDVYTLSRGFQTLHGIERLFFKAHRNVGKLKARISLRAPSSSAPETQVIQEESVRVRLYILNGLGLAPRDANGFSDPYVKVKLGGKTIFNDQKNYIPKSRDAQFYTCVEFTTVLPGVSNLQVTVMDYDFLDHDDEIGSTEIDLEDRWLMKSYARGDDKREFRAGDRVRCLMPNKVWCYGEIESDEEDVHGKGSANQQQMSQNNGSDKEKGPGGADEAKEEFAPIAKQHKVRADNGEFIYAKATEIKRADFRHEPLEFRSLWLPTAKVPQGRLETFLELVPESKANEFPKWNIQKPPDREFEVRVVVWRVKLDGKPGDVFSGLTDMYTRCKLGPTSAWQSTDIHARAAHGKASFNWRCKFNVSLPLRGEARAHKYLSFQFWDKDIVKYDDLLATHDLDISGKLEEAFEQQSRGLSPLFAFGATPKPKGNREEPYPKAEILRIRGECEDRRYDVQYEDGECEFDLPASSFGEGNSAPREGDSVEVKCGSGKFKDPIAMTTKATTCCRNLKVRGKDCLKEVRLFCLNTLAQIRYNYLKSDGEDAQTSFNFDVQENEALLNDSLVDEKREEKHQIPPGPGLCAQFLSALGYDNDAFKPPNTRWIKIYDRDAQHEKKKCVGKMLLSLDIVPKEWADQHPAGFGRNEPNENPRLPSPAGRLDWSRMWNPIYFIPALCGNPGRFCLFFTIAGGILTGIYFSMPHIYSIYAFAEKFGDNGIVALEILAVVTLLLVCCAFDKFRRCCCAKECPLPCDVCCYDDEAGVDIESQ